MNNKDLIQFVLRRYITGYNHNEIKLSNGCVFDFNDDGKICGVTLDRTIRQPVPEIVYQVVNKAEGGIANVYVTTHSKSLANKVLNELSEHTISMFEEYELLEYSVYEELPNITWVFDIDDGRITAYAADMLCGLDSVEIHDMYVVIAKTFEQAKDRLLEDYGVDYYNYSENKDER